MKGKQRVAVVGGTGLIGKHLVDLFLSDGFEVSLFTRNIEKADNIFKGKVGIFQFNDDLTESLENQNVIVNLAGETISKRWTGERRKRILDSRVNNTSRIVNSINKLKNKPDIYLQASAPSQ